MMKSKRTKGALSSSAGWRAGLGRCTGAAAFVALLNILFLSIAAPHIKESQRTSSLSTRTVGDGVQGGVHTGPERPGGGALFEGSCETAKDFSVWLHLAINLLSTVLLTSGNYTQQVLTAPTREEIDRAHGKHSWLHLGILSYRNLRGISKRRVLAWAILALTSVPIHLLYNSVVSLEISANEYKIGTVRANEISSVPDEFERLENDECISQYARQFVTNRSDLLMVVPSEFNDTYTIEITPWDSQPLSPTGWMCMGKPEPCDATSLKAESEDWTIFDIFDIRATEPIPINYCLSKPVEESCRLNMSVPLMAIVVGTNVLKLIGLSLTWIFLEKEPLLTLGDAVACFLKHPDPTTRDSHLLCVGPSFRTLKSKSKSISKSREWKRIRRRWAFFISPWIYALTMICSLVVIIVAAYLLEMGIKNISYGGAPSFVDMWNRGFGSIDVDCLVMHRASALKTSLLSNTPQLIVSIIYTGVNGIWTAMMVGNEWNGYGLRRKALRTTDPTGKQRSTYWLSLPWKYGLPLAGASALLHWLISQSIFVVRIIVWGREPGSGFLTVALPGYSPIAIIFAIICGGIIVLATVGISLVPCKMALPQVGTCSAVVSAACHPPEGDEDAAMEEVQWGVVVEQGGIEEGSGEMEEGRCCLTSWEVTPPVDGKFY